MEMTMNKIQPLAADYTKFRSAGLGRNRSRGIGACVADIRIIEVLRKRWPRNATHPSEAFHISDILLLIRLSFT